MRPKLQQLLDSQFLDARRKQFIQEHNALILKYLNTAHDVDETSVSIIICLAGMEESKVRMLKALADVKPELARRIAADLMELNSAATEALTNGAPNKR